MLVSARRHGRPARQAHQIGVAAPLRILQAAQAVVGARVGVQHRLQGGIRRLSPTPDGSLDSATQSGSWGRPNEQKYTAPSLMA